MNDVLEVSFCHGTSLAKWSSTQGVCEITLTGKLESRRIQKDEILHDEGAKPRGQKQKADELLINPSQLERSVLTLRCVA
jgi:hypothetical protein